MDLLTQHTVPEVYVLKLVYVNMSFILESHYYYIPCIISDPIDCSEGSICDLTWLKSYEVDAKFWLKCFGSFKDTSYDNHYRGLDKWLEEIKEQMKKSTKQMH